MCLLRRRRTACEAAEVSDICRREQFSVGLDKSGLTASVAGQGFQSPACQFPVNLVTVAAPCRALFDASRIPLELQTYSLVTFAGQVIQFRQCKRSVNLQRSMTIPVQ